MAQHQPGASKPFSLNPTGTHSRRHPAHFVSAIYSWKVGLARATANERWLYALCVIAWRLNGRLVPDKRSRRRIIGLVRDADMRGS